MALHRFSRVERLVGTEGLERMRAAHVVVFGVGGVGSYAAEALARGGVGRLTLVDFDDICLTNVNRQIHALDGALGRPKVEVMAERCRAINPKIQVAALKRFYDAHSSAELLEGPPDYVLDCIDHITSKLHLLQSCVEQSIPVLSSMGAGNKLDPTLIRVEDIGRTSICRLARTIRKELRKRGIKKGVRVVYSTEEFRPLLPGSGGCAVDCICPNKEDQQWGCEHRRVILGTSSYIPPLFGLTMAGEAIRSLLKEG